MQILAYIGIGLMYIAKCGPPAYRLFKRLCRAVGHAVASVKDFRITKAESVQMKKNIADVVDGVKELIDAALDANQTRAHVMNVAEKVKEKLDA